jgi:hypothetical protein
MGDRGDIRNYQQSRGINLKKLPNESSDLSPHLLLEVDCLEKESLEQLFLGKVSAIVVKNFYPKDPLQKFADLVVTHPLKDGYGVDQDIIRTGTSFYDTNGNANFRKEFLDSSMNWMQNELLRFSFCTPIYAVFLALMTIWCNGIQFENLDGKSMWAGSARIFDRVGCLVHRDNLGADAPEFERALQLFCQIAVNIYAQVPDEGAEIDIWDICLSEEEYNERCVPGSYGIDCQQLPPPTITISPKVGDLILFNSNCLHMARPSNGVSIAHSCFMGFRGYDVPLTVWS